MTYKTYHDVFLANSEVKDFVADYRKLHYIATSKAPANDEEWAQAYKDLTGVSPIEIVEEKERNKTHNTDGFIQGWDDNTVVLRPAGDAVKFVHKSILDERMDKQYGAKAITSVYGRANNGLGVLRNAEIDNGRFKEWHSDMMMSACPVLIDVPYHHIYNISKAG